MNGSPAPLRVRYHQGMAPAVAKMLSEALALPSAERAELAQALLRSLDVQPDQDLTPSDWNAAWGAEIHRRIDRHKAGLSKSVPWSEMREALLAELQARRDDPGR